MIKKIKSIIFLPFILLSIQSHAQETFLLNYQDVDIAKVTQDISKFSKKTLILDQRVKGRISIFSDSILSAEQVWDVYLRTIQVHGFAALSDGGVVRIVPENEATRDSNVSLSQSSIETKIFTLKNRAAGEILSQIKDDPEIGILVLGAGIENKGPGPLITQLTKSAGSLPIPMTIVPGDLSKERLEALT